MTKGHVGREEDGASVPSSSRTATEERPRMFPGRVVWTGATGWVDDPPICLFCGENGHPVETITDMVVWHHVDADLEDDHDFSAVDGRALVIFDPEKMSEPIPDDFEVRPIENRGEKGTATCGTCDLSWNDDLPTSMTPVPSGRCPFEYFHAEHDDFDFTDGTGISYGDMAGMLDRMTEVDLARTVNLCLNRMTQSMPDLEARALDGIAGLLSGEEWDSQTASDVARIVRATGREVAEPNID